MLRQRIPTLGLVLLGLLVLTTAGRADEAAAVKVIKELGGSVQVDDQRPGQRVVSVNFVLTKVTDAGLKELKNLKSLQSLVIIMIESAFFRFQCVNLVLFKMVAVAKWLADS